MNVLLGNKIWFPKMQFISGKRWFLINSNVVTKKGIKKPPRYNKEHEFYQETETGQTAVISNSAWATVDRNSEKKADLKNVLGKQNFGLWSTS